MPLDYSFSCPLPNGVHARPASALEEVARTFAADVILLNQRTGRSANAKSILSIVGADIRFSDPCLLKVSGADEEQAMASLGSFIRNSLPRQEMLLPVIKAVDGELAIAAMPAKFGSDFPARHGGRAWNCARPNCPYRRISCSASAAAGRSRGCDIRTDEW